MLIQLRGLQGGGHQFCPVQTMKHDENKPVYLLNGRTQAQAQFLTIIKPQNRVVFFPSPSNQT